MSVSIYPESEHEFNSAELLHRYMYGGKGILTLESPSGTTHTYKFSKPKNTSEFPDDVIFVYTLHEGEKLFYVGMIEQDKFRLTKNSRFLSDNDIVKGARYIMRMSKDDNFLRRSPMKIYHEGVCCRCGRELTDEKSLRIGIGPKCLRKMRKDFDYLGWEGIF